MIATTEDAPLSEDDWKRRKSVIPLEGSGRRLMVVPEPNFDFLAPFIRGTRGRGIVYMESQIGTAWHWLANKCELPVSMYCYSMSEPGRARSFCKLMESKWHVLLTDVAAVLQRRVVDLDWVMFYDPPASIEELVIQISHIGHYTKPLKVYIRDHESGWQRSRASIDQRYIIRIDPVIQDRWKKYAYDRLDLLRQIVATRPARQLAHRIDAYFAELLPDCVARRVALGVRIGKACGRAVKPLIGPMTSGLVPPDGVTDLVSRFCPNLVGYATMTNRLERQITEEFLAVCQRCDVPACATSLNEIGFLVARKRRFSADELMCAMRAHWPDMGDATVAEAQARWIALSTAWIAIPGWAVGNGSWEPLIDVN